MTDLPLLHASWPAPSHVVALTTLRFGGASPAPYDSFNLALHVGDRPENVRRNRESLAAMLAVSLERFAWLEQVHGNCVVDAAEPLPGTGITLSPDRRTPKAAQLPQADGVCSSEAQRVCVVLTADCLPVLFTDRRGTWVAAAHAGWRGLASGILETTVATYQGPPDEVMAWLGPAIGPAAFEVGSEVRQSFVGLDPALAQAFSPSRHDFGKYFLDLYLAATLRLRNLGVHSIHGGGFCTHTDESRFYSYRRQAVTGRMASLIYLKS